MVCSYITLKRSGVTHASFPAALAHWSIYKKGQAGVQGYTLHSYIPIKSVDRHLQAVGRVELHIDNIALQFTLATFQECETYLFICSLSRPICVSPTIMHFLHGTKISM